MYRNKNLIYVNGKPYREQDLQDMIDYYRENYKPDIRLPSNWNDDVSGQVFKNYPFYPSISKSTYRPELYYDKNCNYDISFKEFLDYVMVEEPERFVIMLMEEYDDVGIVVRLGYITKNNDSTYTYKDYYINADENQVNVGDDYTYTIQDIIKFIIVEYDTRGKYRELWYDLLTVDGIYGSRKRCTEYNKNYKAGMLIRYVKQFLNKVPAITDKNTFIKYYSYYLYILFIILVNNSNNNGTQAINYIEAYIALLNDGIPDDVNDMNELLEDYIIKDIITVNDKTQKISLNLMV